PGRSGDAANGDSPKTVKEPPAKPVAEKEPGKTEIATIRGKVLNADGRPLAKVPIRLWSYRNGDKLREPIATTDADGMFQFKPAQQEVDDNAVVLIAPNGSTAEWLPLSHFKGEQTIKLPADDVPF